MSAPTLDYLCPRCKQWKARDEVYLRPNGKVARCRVCDREVARKSQAKHRLARRYKITQQDYDRLVEAQEGRCPICEQRRKLGVDHNHTTGQVRFLLCSPCNMAEGLLQGDPERVERLARYLRVFTED